MLMGKRGANTSSTRMNLIIDRDSFFLSKFFGRTSKGRQCETVSNENEIEFSSFQSHSSRKLQLFRFWTFYDLCNTTVF